MERILITGATGFVGCYLVDRLIGRHELVLAVRDAESIPPRPGVTAIGIGSIGPQTDWSRGLDGCDVVVHLAAQTPGRNIPESAFAIVNDQGTSRLAAQAAKAGIRLFVNISSLHAISSDNGEPLVGDETVPHPSSHYGRSKLAAEEHVARLVEHDVRAVSLRPPLVTGAQASGNWRMLMRLAASGPPLPVGGLVVPRSVISADNLVDAILAIIAADHRAAPSGRFLVADAQPVTLRDILKLLRQGMGIAPRIFDVPRSLLAVALKPAGSAVAQALLGGTVVDASQFRRAYGWTPPLTAAEGIIRSGRMFMEGRSP